MLRSCLCGLAVLALSGGVVLAEKKAEKKDKTVTGSFVAYKDGALTLQLPTKKGEEPKPTEFKVADDKVKVTTIDGDNRKEGTVKDALAGVKAGTRVTVILGEGDKVTAVQVLVGAPKQPEKPAEKKGTTVSGTFASYKDGTLTVKVPAKKGQEARTQELKVAADVKVVTFEGDAKKEGTAGDAFTAVKEGTPVTVTVGEGDKVTAVQVGAAKKAEKKPAEKTKTVAGTFSSFKDGTLAVKLKAKKGEEAKTQ